MSSVGRITSSALSAVSEITLTAANLNFDFSLVKVEAPAEYEAIGRVLSPGRVREAEDGAFHSTARKLAALFEPLLDRTPELFKAYGIRTSEIASDPDINPTGSAQAHGLFFQQVGADCTSIWAAATSGRSAIAVHLLACMLARLWKPEEATSIWVDIVEARKREILQDDDLTGLEKLALSTAAKQNIAREQLAHWDASARSWLQCADEAQGIKTKQTQLLLILKNVALPVNTIGNTYQSVLQAWKSAMSLVENLIRGQPQEVHDGSVLLGLSAWHIFPDLVVIGQTTTTIKQRDLLVSAGGILTLGLFESNSQEGVGGISWSLPLASLNFYGDPVMSAQSLDPDTPRLTYQEMSMIGLGSLLSPWEPDSSEAALAAQCLVELWAFLERNSLTFQMAEYTIKTSSNSMNAQPWRWLKVLCDGARRFLGAEGLLRERAISLLRLGRRRASEFLSFHHNRQDDLLGLLDSYAFIRAVEDTEMKIAYLRQWIGQCQVDAHDFIIQYTVQKQTAVSETRYRRCVGFDESNSSTSQEPCNEGRDTFTHWEHATAIEIPSRSLKHDAHGLEIRTKRHKRWIAVRPQALESPRSSCLCSIRKLVSCPCSVHRCISGPVVAYRQPDLTNLRFQGLSAGGETICTEEQTIIEDPGQDLKSFTWLEAPDPRLEPGNRSALYVYLAGNPGDVALFYRPGWFCDETTRQMSPRTNPGSLLALWINALQTNSLDPNQVRDLLCHQAEMFEDYFVSLDALSAACDLYEAVAGATISPTVTSRSLRGAQWYRSYSSSLTVATLQAAARRTVSEGFLQYPAPKNLTIFRTKLTRSEAFSCIALFESGNIDLPPEQLQKVMALSSGNSIYIALQLLRDPVELGFEHEVRRIAGNVGQVGTSFLVPPGNPRVKTVDENSWHVINHQKFDGQLEDSFAATSCHLSFTNYKMPVTLPHQVHGRQDVESSFLETVISVYDSGKWVADLDILACLSSMDLFRLHCRPSCTGKSSWGGTEFYGRLTSVDNWEEILDRPKNAVVVRAHGNWLARLAMASFAVAQGCKVVVLPKNVCWSCCVSLNRSLRGNEVFIT